MKKFSTLFLAASMVMGVSVVQSAEFTPGTYTASAKGNGGEVPVTVTFSKNAIESIKVGQNKETPGIGSVAIEQLPAAIVKDQNLGLDGVTGASITSKAILTAVAACVTKAGGNPADLTKATKHDQQVKQETLNTDIAIVGAGAAGQQPPSELLNLVRKLFSLKKCHLQVVQLQ